MLQQSTKWLPLYSDLGRACTASGREDEVCGCVVVLQWGGKPF